MTPISQKRIEDIVHAGIPERLSLEARPPITEDHVAHLCQLTQMGQTCLAADHLLFPEKKGFLAATVTGTIRALNISFYQSKLAPGETEQSLIRKIHSKQYAYEVLLETALNFYGLESRWLDSREKEEALRYILKVLEAWERTELEEGEGSVAAAVVKKWLVRMKKVQKGNSMVAKTASRIEAGYDAGKAVLADLLKSAEEEIKGNIYYQMVKGINAGSAMTMPWDSAGSDTWGLSRSPPTPCWRPGPTRMILTCPTPFVTS